MKNTVYLICIALLCWAFEPAFCHINYDGDDIENTNMEKTVYPYCLTLANYTPKAPNKAPQNVSYPSRGIIFILTPSYSQILNEDLASNVNGKFGFNVEVGYFMKFSRTISVGAGIGYSIYNSTLSSESTIDSLSGVDIDDHNVINIMSTNQFSEELHIGYIDIPIYLEFGNPNIDKVGFYGRIGIKVSFPVNSNMTGEGTFTSWGYYPDCPVELRDIPELGYYTDQPLYNGQEEIKLNPVVFSAFLSGGVSFPISSSLVLKIGINANLGLSEISEVKNTEMESNFDYSKLLSNPTKTSISSFGLEVGLIYSLRLF